MSDSGRILLADDEETFLHATADLLRKEGFDCDTATDGHEAAGKLAQDQYDLLIADIKMPGNMGLDLIKQLPVLAAGMPVILATGYPSMTTAIDAVQLPVSAYVVKPCDFEDLLGKVRDCLDESQARRAIEATRERLEDWQGELANIGEWARTASSNPAKLTTSAYLTLTIENIIGSLLDIKHLVEAMAARQGQNEVLPLLRQRQEEMLREQIESAAEVLRRKESESGDPELRMLRERLENALARSRH